MSRTNDKQRTFTARERHAEKLIEWLADPGKEWPTKVDLSLAVLGKKDPRFVCKNWTPAEFEREILEPALKLRRAQYARQSSRVDAALIARACEGDVQAARLFYQRLEGWNPAQRTEAKLEVSGDLTLADVLNKK